MRSDLHNLRFCYSVTVKKSSHAGDSLKSLAGITEQEVFIMKKGLTELVMILDRSGSMAGLESDTIGGFNSMIEKQKKEDGEAYVSVVLFDDRSDVIYDRVPVEKVEPMTTSEDARPSSMQWAALSITSVMCTSTQGRRTCLRRPSS